MFQTTVKLCIYFHEHPYHLFFFPDPSRQHGKRQWDQDFTWPHASISLVKIPNLISKKSWVSKFQNFEHNQFEKMADISHFSNNESVTENLSIIFTSENYSSKHQQDYYIFDKVYVRIIFILLYSIVFCLCFFGKCFQYYYLLLTNNCKSIK